MFREEATSTLAVFIQVLSPGRFGIWKRRSEQKIGEPAKPTYRTPGGIEP